jgi:hypothetical protein
VRNRFQEPSLELSSLATYRLAGRYDNPMPTWFLAPIAGLKLPTLDAIVQKKAISYSLAMTRDTHNGDSEKSSGRVSPAILEQ